MLFLQAKLIDKTFRTLFFSRGAGSNNAATKIAKTDAKKPKAEFSKAKKEPCPPLPFRFQNTVKTTFYVLSFASSLGTLEDSRKGEF